MTIENGNLDSPHSPGEEEPNNLDPDKSQDQPLDPVIDMTQNDDLVVLEGVQQDVGEMTPETNKKMRERIRDALILRNMERAEFEATMKAEMGDITHITDADDDTGTLEE